MGTACPNCLVLEQRLAQLEAVVQRRDAEIEKLRQLLEQSQRSGKRQAAPFSKGQPQKHPKKPGRKPGAKYGKRGRRSPPDHVDETYEAPLPDACPECGGDLLETHVAPQYQEEIPRQPIRRQFNIHFGECRRCGRHCQGRHPLQTSDAVGAAASQVGPDAQAAIVYLNKRAGLSHGKIAHTLRTLFGIQLTPGASAQVVLRAGRRLQDTYQEIQEHLKQSAVITPDETGWRIGGHLVWLHAWVGDDGVTCYHIDPRRGSDALQRVLGIDWSGTLVHDGWASYDQFEDACHQQCQAHVLRRAHDLEEAATGRAKVFPRQVIGLFQESLQVRNQFVVQPPDDETRGQAFEDFTERLIELTARPRANAANERLARHLSNHAGDWFMFFIDPSIPATNYLGEQALRPAVVNRKVWGGNRTPAGADAQEITMSVLQTCSRRAVDALSYISATLRGFVASLFVSATAAAGR
jgi:transposase